MAILVLEFSSHLGRILQLGLLTLSVNYRTTFTYCVVSMHVLLIDD
jgi:hypothetical protein